FVNGNPSVDVQAQAFVEASAGGTNNQPWVSSSARQGLPAAGLFSTAGIFGAASGAGGGAAPGVQQAGLFSGPGSWIKDLIQGLYHDAIVVVFVLGGIALVLVGAQQAVKPMLQSKGGGGDQADTLGAAQLAGAGGP